MPVGKKEKLQISDCSFHLKKVGKKEHKLISKLVKEAIMIRTEINENINRKTIENKTERWFFEKLNKIGNLLTRLIKKRWENQITRIR